MSQQDIVQNATESKAQEKTLVALEVSGSKNDTGPSKYPGTGTRDDPFLIDWDLDDPEYPYNWSNTRRWIITIQLGLATWTVSFCSSSFTGGLPQLMRDLHVSQEVALLGVSVYVIGFGLGPLLFAPLSEVFGRRPVFLVTYGILNLFLLGCALSPSITPMLVCRFFAGTFGSSPLTNSSGTVSDIWTARERGVASAVYATAPFLGPVFGPLISGWVAESRLGWRFNFWIMLICSGFSLAFGFLVTPETYGPALLRKKAQRLTNASGGKHFYVSKMDHEHHKSFSALMRVSMTRPFLFLATEPIVLLISIYIAIAYAILYSFFAAFPIVFQEHRGFSTGQGGLTFLGVGIGVAIGTSMAPLQNRLYWRAMAKSPTGKAPPEARLYFPMFAAIVLPVGLFWFAWTSDPPVPWIVPILAGIPTGTGVAQIMIGLVQYLIDTYTIYCASAIAATVLLRSILAAVFPLISPPMYKKLGDPWAVSIFAIIALVCTPLPWMFYKYGAWIRSKSAYARHGGMPPPSASSPSTDEKQNLR
ncbi:MFS general substrate transporter [Panus rudis PR-1116 ss-1]|nr:MFS general substrate transporter [Panus rudis PR-1116 ss-1]